MIGRVSRNIKIPYFILEINLPHKTKDQRNTLYVRHDIILKIHEK